MTALTEPADESVRFDGSPEAAVRKLRNQRVVMHLDPNGYENGARAVNVCYVWHEAGRFVAIVDNILNTERGVVSEHRVLEGVREHGCAFLDYDEVPDHVNQ